MSGKIVAGAIVMIALIVGAAIYYLQVYGYYRSVAVTDPGAAIRLVAIGSQQPEEIATDNYRAIDADSSPIRFRACFTTPLSLALLTEEYVAEPQPVPLTGPGWFSCYDAGTISQALDAGTALAFLSEHDIHPGVDRVVAVFPDGRAYAWQQLNDEMKDN